MPDPAPRTNRRPWPHVLLASTAGIWVLLWCSNLTMPADWTQQFAPPAAPREQSPPIQTEVQAETVEQATSPTALHGRRPNIIWVMADDLGWGEVGLFPASSPNGRIATPHLDRLGREGMVFSHAYAGYTVCSPSRTTFFTGRHSGNFRKVGLDGALIHPRQGVKTLSQVLKNAGYTTGLFGKSAPLTAPLKQGFDVFVGQVSQSLCHNMYPKFIDSGYRKLNYKLSGNHQPKDRQRCMEHPELYNYTIDVFHDHGMQWMESVAGGADPFFMYLSFTIPHAGGWGDAPQAPEAGQPVPTDLQYANKSWPDQEKDHAATITYLDGKVGDLLDRLKRLGIDSNTVVFFASDNGAHVEGGHSKAFFDSTGGLRGQKRSLYEGGVRSPSMVRWPGTVPAGSTSDFAWAFWDVLPTMAELAGVPSVPPNDGLSIAATLLGKQQTPHKYLYFTWVCQDSSGKLMAPGYSITVGNLKGVVKVCMDNSNRPSHRDAMAVYNLTSDGGEREDLSAQRTDDVAKLIDLAISEGVTCDCYQCQSGFKRTPCDGDASLAAGIAVE